MLGPVPVLTTSRRLVPVLLGLALVLQLVALYAPDAPGSPSGIPHSDKLVHAVVFGLPVLVAGLGRLTWWPWLALLGAVHAPVSEVIQHVVLPHRSGDPWDVVADLVGLGMASTGVLLVVRQRRCCLLNSHDRFRL